MATAKKGLFYFLLFSAASGLILFPAESRAAAQEGLSLCFSVVIPSLFPFFVLSNLLIATDSLQFLARLLAPHMRGLFGLGGAGAAALLLGLTGGYPLGAKTAAELYTRGELSRKETEQLLTFCSNSGPGFFLGMCATVLQSPQAGMYLYLIHAFAALLCGMLLRQKLPLRASVYCVNIQKRISPLQAFPAAVQSGFSSVWNVCGFVILFLILLQLLSQFPFVCALSPLSKALLFGSVEMTNGIALLPPTEEGFILCAAITGWGGLSVHAQTLALLPPALRPQHYFLGKALHALVSAALAALLAPQLF